ncbi:hypothetical protein [Spartinivicinus poritis]|uniref:Uncharacterized protein n=1 Tax=Spartinivicinus poritis TaxID=2994640 RepID=A0ABT5U3I6_9GAMM|nr:hypothetical protein [Spartinivicinus sp. A2-2]MDE1460928.1 hypothetical protein [Spartinivicinus sp. A2-2]
MEYAKLQTMVNCHQVREGLLKTSETGNGWAVVVEDLSGHQFPLTDQHGHEKLYHSLDNATGVLRELGVTQINVVESF